MTLVSNPKATNDDDDRRLPNSLFKLVNLLTLLYPTMSIQRTNQSQMQPHRLLTFILSFQDLDELTYTHTHTPSQKLPSSLSSVWARTLRVCTLKYQIYSIINTYTIRVGSYKTPHQKVRSRYIFVYIYQMIKEYQKLLWREESSDIPLDTYKCRLVWEIHVAHDDSWQRFLSPHSSQHQTTFCFIHLTTSHVSVFHPH